MKVLAIQKFNNVSKSNNTLGQNPTSHLTTDFQPKSLLPTHYYNPAFQGLKLEENVIKKIFGKKFFGKSIFTKTNFVDYTKIGAEKIGQEDLDITQATDKEITAYRYSLALAESYENSWVRRYNPFNRSYSLSTLHTLNSQTRNNEYYSKFIDILNNKFLCKSLDVPIVHRDGRLALNGVVLDTETTGTSPAKDKIIQLASMQIKDGKAVADKSGIYNQLLNPEVHIPEGASAVNGITDEMVKDAPTINGVLKDYLKNNLNKSNGIVIAYNGFFDVPLLNRCIREYNLASNSPEKEKKLYKVLDPFILIQRIHPFLGARKNLSKQYQWLFCKNMENAHDALADVRGTIDVMKYCLYYIEKHHNPAGKEYPITLREVLAFQFGSPNVKNIEIPLHPTKHFRANASFEPSYKFVPLNVDNYFKNYKLTRQVAENLKNDIGEENFKRLEDTEIIGHKVDLTYKGRKMLPEETKLIPNSSKYQTTLYVMKKNMKKVLGFAKLESFNGKSKDEIEDLIIENSKEYLHEKNVQTWVKNVNPEDIAKGNDLPDMEIARRVMQERAEEDKLFEKMNNSNNSAKTE
jgi:DNA polymerase III epsilon subunit-like protein